MTIITSLLQINEWKQACGVAAGMSTFAIVLCLTVKPRFRNTFRLLIIAIGTPLSIAISMVFAQSYNQFLAAVFIYAGSLYTSLIHKMVLDYVSLVASHLTFKERLVRKTTEKEYCIKDTYKSQKRTFKQELRTVWMFLVHKKIPVSFYL